jgi:branched-chain amino acid transport system ATP-binding protein
LLRVASGLLKPYSGQILIDGVDVTGDPAYKMSRKGVIHVPEGRGIFPSLTVTDNLLLQSPPGEFKKGFKTATSTFPRLGERARQIARTMSGGEQQMLAVGRALMSRPRLLILDEPTTGLAPKLAAEAYQALGQLKEGGLTVLVAEQQVPLAMGLSDRGYVLENGVIRKEGTSAELANDPDVRRSYLGIV